MPRDTEMVVPTADAELPLGKILRPYRRRWRLVLAICAVAWAVGLAVALIPARRYSASVVLAAVPNARNSALTGGITALLGSAQLGGVQSTPYFIAKLLLLRSVVTQSSLSMAQPSGISSVNHPCGWVSTGMAPTLRFSPRGRP